MRLARSRRGPISHVFWTVWRGAAALLVGRRQAVFLVVSSCPPAVAGAAAIVPDHFVQLTIRSATYCRLPTQDMPQIAPNTHSPPHGCLPRLIWAALTIRGRLYRPAMTVLAPAPFSHHRPSLRWRRNALARRCAYCRITQPQSQPRIHECRRYGLTATAIPTRRTGCGGTGGSWHRHDSREKRARRCLRNLGGKRLLLNTGIPRPAAAFFIASRGSMALILIECRSFVSW